MKKYSLLLFLYIMYTYFGTAQDIITGTPQQVINAMMMKQVEKGLRSFAQGVVLTKTLEFKLQESRKNYWDNPNNSKYQEAFFNNLIEKDNYFFFMAMGDMATHSKDFSTLAYLMGLGKEMDGGIGPFSVYEFSEWITNTHLTFLEKLKLQSMSKAIELNRDYYAKYVAKRYLEEYLFRSPTSPLLSSDTAKYLTGIRLAIGDCDNISSCFNSTKDLLGLVAQEDLEKALEGLNGAKFKFGDFEDSLFIEYQYRNVINYWEGQYYQNFEKYRNLARGPLKIEKSKFVDERDGKEYNSVNINGDIWMAENLDYDGVESICYNGKRDIDCSFYGRLYTFSSAKIACPKGWHLPSMEEWGRLVTYAGGNAVAGQYLKSSVDGEWGDSFSKNRLVLNDDYGFAALPGGSYNDEAWKRKKARLEGVWWIDKLQGTKLAKSLVIGGGSNIRYFTEDTTEYFSCRCVKD